MAFTTERLSPDLSYGRRIRGITLDDLADEAVRARIRGMFVQDGLIVFQDCRVTNELHIAASAVCGEIAIHPLSKQMPVDGHPELIKLKYDTESEALFDVDGELLGGYIPWHFDAVFTPHLNRGGILRMETPSKEGGDTGFIDRIDIYGTLPPALKERIERLEVVYSLDYDYIFPFIPNTRIKLFQEGAIYLNSKKRFEAGDFPPVVHPLVYRQKETGRKVLNFSPLMAVRVLGLEPAESHDLLLELARYATDERRAYFHHWHTQDELVLWDNWRMLHKASGVPEDDQRAVIRTTIGGDYSLGRVLEPRTVH
jgi:taurine dioxygenase